MTSAENPCPNCAAPVHLGDKFCEGCGEALSQIQTVAIPQPGRFASDSCVECGNTEFADGYCTQCGTRRAAPDRDQMTIGPVVLMTDRGIEHDRNEDAAAAGILVGARDRVDAIVVAVCDGVSTSGEAQMASGAASKAATDTMLVAYSASGDARSAATAGLWDATRAAAAAKTDQAKAPSCTYTAAIVVPKGGGTAEITVANVGDSRSYWLPAAPEGAVQLTVDDSLAQKLISAGIPEDSAAVQRGAHTLTRWLGADGEAQPWSESSINGATVTGPGLVLLCSDGLWNYVPEAVDLARLCVGPDPASVARALVDYALSCGGHDNITVVLIPIGAPT